MEEAQWTFCSVHMNFPGLVSTSERAVLGRRVVQLISITAKFVVKKQGCRIPGKHRKDRLRYPESG